MASTTVNCARNCGRRGSRHHEMVLHEVLSRRLIEAQGVLRHDAVAAMLREHEEGRAQMRKALDEALVL